MLRARVLINGLTMKLIAIWVEVLDQLMDTVMREIMVETLVVVGIKPVSFKAEKPCFYVNTRLINFFLQYSAEYVC